MARKKKVQVWLYRCAAGHFEYLLLKRPANWHSGEFWQPLTGKVDPGESPQECARREIGEELQIHELTGSIDPGLICRFDKDGTKFAEYVFGFELAAADPQLSHEHEIFEWCDFQQALRKLTFATNIAGLGAIEAVLQSRAK